MTETWFLQSLTMAQIARLQVPEFHEHAFNVHHVSLWHQICSISLSTPGARVEAVELKMNQFPWRNFPLLLAFSLLKTEIMTVSSLFQRYPMGAKRRRSLFFIESSRRSRHFRVHTDPEFHVRQRQLVVVALVQRLQVRWRAWINLTAILVAGKKILYGES